MYKGRRDPKISIIIEQEKCNSYIAKDGKVWVEILIPPENTNDYGKQWVSIMVEKDQVDNIDDESGLNVVHLNNWSKITCTEKDEGHKAVRTERLKPIQIIGRFLKYYRWMEYHETHPEMALELNRPSLDCYNDMRNMGQDMMSYMNRLPKVIPIPYRINDVCVNDPISTLSAKNNL